MTQSNEKIKAIIFDLGRVLVDVDFSRGIFKYTLQGKSQTEDQILDSLMRDRFYQEYACGRVPPSAFHEKICQHLNLDLDFSNFKKAWNDVFKPLTGMDELVRELGKEYKIGLLSDIGPLHWEHCKENLPVLELIKQPVLSYKIGYLKPDPEAYRLAAESVATPPRHCLFIDDREINVAGARSAGMQSIQFIGIEKLHQDLADLGIFSL